MTSSNDLPILQGLKTPVHPTKAGHFWTVPEPKFMLSAAWHDPFDGASVLELYFLDDKHVACFPNCITLCHVASIYSHDYKNSAQGLHSSLVLD